MISNFNENLEREMDKLLQPLYECEFDIESKCNCYIELLKEKYTKTFYPGYLYRIGLLYERFKIGSPKEQYKAASELNYIPAINKLNEICLEEIKVQMMIHGHMFTKPYYSDNPYGKYLLAKYYMMDSINDDTMNTYFNLGLKIMKESATQGCKEAIRFLKTMNIEELSYKKEGNYEIKL